MSYKDTDEKVIDLRDYNSRKYNSEQYVGDLPDDLIRALWVIMLAFAELGFGANPSQNTKSLRDIVPSETENDYDIKAA